MVYEKEELRNFWTSYWIYNKTSQWWIDKCWGSHQPDAYYALRARRRLEMAVWKLFYEKQFKEEQVAEIIKMINSKDAEAVAVAVSLIQIHKPKKFKRDG